MKSLRIFGIVILAVCLCMGLFSLHTYAQVKSAPVTVVNTKCSPVNVTGTVGISSSANTIQLAEGSFYAMTLSVHVYEGDSFGWATEYTLEVPFKTDIWTISCGVPPGQQPEVTVRIQVGTSMSSNLYSVMTFQQTRGSKDYFNATPPWKVALPAGTLLNLGLQRGDYTTGYAMCELSITGTTTP